VKSTALPANLGVRVDCIGVGRGAGGQDPLNLDIFRKKRLFSSFEWEKTNFTTFCSPLEKFWKNPLLPTWKKSFKRPWFIVL